MSFIPLVLLVGVLALALLVLKIVGWILMTWLQILGIIVLALLIDLAVAYVLASRNRAGRWWRR